MNKLIQHINRADKRKLFIYLFSFLTFLVINNIIANIINLPLRGEFKINIIISHAVPCLDNPSLIYLFSCQALKILFFVFFWFYIKKNPSSYIAEILISFFIYDLVYVLAEIWDLFHVPYIHAVQMLYSSPQAIFNGYFYPSTFIISLIWSAFLLWILYKQNRLSIIYLTNRLIIVPFSVVILCFAIASTIYYTHQYQTHYYHVSIGKNYYYSGRVFNITTQEIIKGEPSESIIIKFPTRVDSITFFDRNGDMHRDTSTSSYFTVQRIEDTISGKAIDSLINAKIRVGYTVPIQYNNESWYQKVTGFKMQVLFPDGTSYNNYIEGNKISLDKEAVKEIHKNINNSYIVIGTVFFLNEKGEEMKINDNVAWKLKY